MAKRYAHNAADPKAQARLERLNARRHERLIVTLRAVLATPAGRAFLWDLMARSFVYRSVYNQSVAEMAFLEGGRNVGLAVRGLTIEADEALYELMEREGRALERRDAAELEGLDTPPATTAERDDE